MKEKIKIRIAKEVIIFYSIITLLTIAYAVLFSRNAIIENTIGSTEIEIQNLKKKLFDATQIKKNYLKKKDSINAILQNPVKSTFPTYDGETINLMQGIIKYSDIYTIIETGKEKAAGIIRQQIISEIEEDEYFLSYKKYRYKELKREQKENRGVNLSVFESWWKFSGIFSEMTKVIGDSNYILRALEAKQMLLSDFKKLKEITMENEKKIKLVDNKIDSLKKTENKIIKKIQELNHQILKTKDRIIENIDEFILNLTLILLVIAYPLRGSSLLLIWALKTLRNTHFSNND